MQISVLPTRICVTFAVFCRDTFCLIQRAEAVSVTMIAKREKMKMEKSHPPPTIKYFYFLHPPFSVPPQIFQKIGSRLWFSGDFRGNS